MKKYWKWWAANEIELAWAALIVGAVIVSHFVRG
jgi:hypothetical protein